MNQPTVRSETDLVLAYLMDLQDRICQAFEALEPTARFDSRVFPGERGGSARPRVIEGGVLEKAAVHLSHSVGDSLPAAATERRPELAGRGFEAVSLSLITHPRNPHAPTSHMNLRFFVAPGLEASDQAVWWFGGGFDLTPYYGFVEDAVHWHRTAKAACDPFGPTLHTQLKEWCDRYFFLPHRGEARGVGGLFFDDLCELGPAAPGDTEFERCFGLLRSVGDHYLPAYGPLLERRKDTEHGERERAHQLMRRGRYVEFNLLYDRGTRFGLQAGGRTESILSSLPNVAHWQYDHQPEEGSPEAKLLEEYLRPRDWIGEFGAD